MKATNTAIALALTISITGCAQWQANEDSPTFRVGPQYTAQGYIDGVSAYVYGNRTLLRFKNDPLTLSVYDTAGNSVDFVKAGAYYRLSKQLDSFKIRVDLLKTTQFKIDTTRRPPQNPVAIPAEVEEDKNTLPASLVYPQAQASNVIVTTGPRNAAPTVARNQTVDDLAALIAVSRRQLEEVQAAIQQGAPDLAEIERMSAKLNSIEKNLLDSSSILYTQRFARNQSQFSPDRQTTELLISVAQVAESIKIRGRTDSNNAGKNDKRIALERAESARAFLVSQGINPSKININYLGAGDHIAPNYTLQGRDINRRVEVEFIHPNATTKAEVVPSIQQNNAIASNVLAITVKKGSLFENIGELSKSHGWNNPARNFEGDWIVKEDFSVSGKDFADCISKVVARFPVVAHIDKSKRVVTLTAEAN